MGNGVPRGTGLPCETDVMTSTQTDAVGGGSPLRDGTVDWDAADQDVPCARCGYNLRGIELPRCPECGLAFDWEELFLPERRRHPFLYEHHTGTDRRRRLIRTLLAGLRPIKFWRSMRITHLHRRRPLIGFAVFGLLLASLAAMLAGITTHVKLPPRTGPGFVDSAGRKVTPTISAEDAIVGTLEGVLDSTIAHAIALARMDRSVPMVPILLWGWYAATIVPLTVFGFWLFGSTLRKYKVLTSHLWRLTVYPGAVCLPLGGLAAAANRIAVQFLDPTGSMGMSDGQSLSAVILAATDYGIYDPLWFLLRSWLTTNGALLPVALLWVVSLWAGGACYLRIRGWWLVVVASQVIAAIVVLGLAVQVGIL